jgi:hypothetical protein
MGRGGPLPDRAHGDAQGRPGRVHGFCATIPQQQEPTLVAAVRQTVGSPFEKLA